MKQVWNPQIELMSYEEVYERYVRCRLEEQLLMCMKKSRFYRNKYALEGVDAHRLFIEGRFGEVPLTDKKELIEDQLDHPPYGSTLCVPVEMIRRIHRTSGSTGRPLYIALTQKDIEVMHEVGARCFWSSGLRQHHTVVHCLNFCMWMGGLSDDLSLEAVGATVIPYGVGNSRGLIDLIQTLKVNAISCTPSYMTRLEEIVRNELNIDPRDMGLQLGLFGGEPGIQNVENRRRIEDVWGIEAMDGNYGMADVLSMFGSECNIKDGLHYHGQGVLHVELIDPHSLDVLNMNKGQIGELVFTNIVREGQPLIRFRSRDVVEISDHEKCGCGRGAFRFKVMGRSDDMLHVRGVNVFPTAVGNIVSRYIDAFTGEYEIELKSPPPLQRLPLRIERKRGVNNEVMINALKKFEQNMRDELSISVDCECVDEGVIARTEGKKKRIVRSY